LRTSRALAAFEGADHVTLDHLRRIAPMALRHRLRRNVLDDADSTTRVERAVSDLWGATQASA
jgi:magnesium chelatase subunit I